MRPHGHARVRRSWPEAFGVCDRCGFLYNHNHLQWQFQWQGPKLQNLRILVCKSCLDIPQEQLRTIILPPDPVPIQNPRPEAYTSDNNPNSAIGQAPLPDMPGANIGTLIGGAGTYAAFDGVVDKSFVNSANLSISGSSFANWVGKNWNDPRSLQSVTGSTASLAYMALSFTAYAPNDASFLGSGATTYAFQQSSDGSTWTTIASGTTAGTAGETVSPTLSGATASQYHRFVVSGDGVTSVAVAQLIIDTDRGYTGIL